MTHAYLERPQPAPEQCPCLTCAVYGPYCADACAQFDAWDEAGRPGPTATVHVDASSEHNHAR